MIRTYFLLAYRNLLANRLTSFINIVGLSVAVACAITVFLVLKNYWTLDNFHQNGDRIFMVEYVQQDDEDTGKTQTLGDAPAPLAAELTAHFPQVKQAVRVERERVQVFDKETLVDETLTYADTNFFSLFTFPLHYGDPRVLADPTALIISHEVAEKYFPGQVPIGQPFTLRVGTHEQKQFTIQGVAQPFPTNAGFHFDFLTGYHSIHTSLKKQDWTTHLSGLFVETNQPADGPLLAGQLSRYVALYNASNREAPIKSFVLENLRHPAPDAHEVLHRPTEANHPLITVLFGLIALVMMAVSCANYVNIALGSVPRRLKEIGVRKVMGGTRQQLILQFMIENLLLCTVALGLGLLLTAGFLVPLFNDVMVLNIALSFTNNAPLWVFLLGILLFTALASGAYPALYVSAFRPIAVFAGRQQFGSRQTLGRILLVGQFALAFIAVIIGVVLSSAGRQWRDLAWGYDPNPTLVVRLTDSTQYTILKNELARHAAVQTVAGAVNHVGESLIRQPVRIGAQEKQVIQYRVGADYLDALGLQLAAGRSFDATRTVENAQSVLINETFAQQQGWSVLSAPGKVMRVDSQLVTVAGVVRNFKLFGSGVARPVLFRTAEAPQFQYLLVRFAPSTGPALVADLERFYKATFPHTTLSAFYQKDVFNDFNDTSEKLAKGFGYLAGLALLIACLGLYGLAVQHFTRRVKEVSVRKVLGATVGQVVLLVNREFVTLLVLAGGLANVLCWLWARWVLANTQAFTGAFQLSAWPFVVANVLVLLTAAVAVARQSLQLANVRLAETLKNTD